MPAPSPERKGLAKMERRDVRITVRYSDTEAERFRVNGLSIGEEVSRYIRRCSLVGDSVIQATGSLKATGA